MHQIKVAMALLLLLALLAVAVNGAQSTEGHGRTDQIVVGQERVTYQIRHHETIGQSFVPTDDTISGVTLGLQSFNPGGDTITVRLRAGTITGPIIASVSEFIPQYRKQVTTYLEHFDFATPVTVTPGTVYVIEVDATQPSHAWATTNDVYANGSSILFGQPWIFDFIFETCSAHAGHGCKSNTVEMEPGTRRRSHGPPSPDPF